MKRTVAATALFGAAALAASLLSAGNARAFEMESSTSSLSASANFGEAGILGSDGGYDDPVKYHSHDETTITAPMMGLAGMGGDTTDYASQQLIPAPPAQAPAWVYSSPAFVHR